MKNRISTLITAITLTLTLISSVFAQGLKLEEGTPLTLRLQQELSSATAQPGQTVTFEVVDEVRIGNTVVIAEGAIATGTVVEVEAKRRLGRAGKLAFRLDYVKTVNGTKVPIRATSINKGKGEGVTTGVLVGGAALVFLPAAPLFLLIKGKDITVPKGQRIDAFVDATRTLQLIDEEDSSFTRTSRRSR